MRAQDRVRDIRAVVAMPQLDETFRPDEFCGPEDSHGLAEDFGLPRVGEPFVADRHRRIGRGEDHVEEMRALEDLSKPALVLDFDRVPERLEMRENACEVAGLAEDVEVLGLA